MRDEDLTTETRSHPLGTPKAGLSPALDALAAFVSSLDAFPKSPYRNPDGTLTRQALHGRELFDSLDCGGCHAGERLTDSALGVLHDVGTLKTTSGQRLGEPLEGLDTPTLRGLWATAPYLHDGSAATLYDVLDEPKHGNAQGLSAADKQALVALLLQLEDTGDISGEPLEPTPTREAGCGCRTAYGWTSQPPAWWLSILVLAFARRRQRRQGAESARVLSNATNGLAGALARRRGPPYF
jgi:MYXO-CTERM domain-containing protein